MKSLAIAVVAGVGLSGAAHAAIAFSNFGPGDSYNTSTGWAIQGANGNKQSIGEQFTAAAGGTVENIRIALVGSEVPHLLNVILREDSGNAMGSVMVAWGFTLDNVNPIRTFNNPFPSVVLTMGNSYWVEVKAVDPDTITAWQYSLGGTGRLAWSNNGGASYNYGDGFAQSAFDVTVVPEPATLAAMGCGLALLRRRRRA